MSAQQELPSVLTEFAGQAAAHAQQAYAATAAITGRQEQCAAVMLYATETAFAQTQCVTRQATATSQAQHVMPARLAQMANAEQPMELVSRSQAQMPAR